MTPYARKGRPLRSPPITPEDYIDYLPMEHVHQAIRRSYYFGQDIGEPHGGMVSFYGKNEEEEAMVHALDGTRATRYFTYDDRNANIADDLNHRLAITARNNLVAFLSLYCPTKALARVFDMKPSQVSWLKSESKWKTRPAPFLKITLKQKRKPRRKPFRYFDTMFPRRFPIILTVKEFFNMGKLYADGELIPAHEIPFLRQNTWVKSNTHSHLR